MFDFNLEPKQERVAEGLPKPQRSVVLEMSSARIADSPPAPTGGVSPKMMSGSSSQRAARRKSRKGAMMPPKSHSPEQSDTPKFLWIKQFHMKNKH